MVDVSSNKAVTRSGMISLIPMMRGRSVLRYYVRINGNERLPILYLCVMDGGVNK